MGSLTDLPSTLRLLLVDNNRLDGAFPNLRHMVNLKHVSAFSNSFNGKLEMSSSALETVLVYGNKLSCQISTSDEYKSVLGANNLITPGNRFSKPSPDWASMSDVTFMFATDTWDLWGETCVLSALGLASLAYLVVYHMRSL